MATEFQLLCHMTYDVKHDGGNNHGVLKHSSVSWRVRVGGSGQAVAGDVDRMFGVTLYRVPAPQPATAGHSHSPGLSHISGISVGRNGDGTLNMAWIGYWG